MFDILDTLARVSQWVRCNIARSRWRGAKHATTTINPTLNESVFKVSDGFQSNEVEMDWPVGLQQCSTTFRTKKTIYHNFEKLFLPDSKASLALDAEAMFTGPLPIADAESSALVHGCRKRYLLPAMLLVCCQVSIFVFPKVLNVK